MDRKFRIAENRDLVSINRIYNQAIEHGHQTADICTLSLEQTQDWYAEHNLQNYPVFVMEVDSRVLAYSSLSCYRGGRQALEKVAEISYYIDHSHLRQGHGNELMKYTLREAITCDFQILVAILLDTNLASQAILKKFKFSEWGRIPKAAIIDGQRVDHLYFGIQL